MFLTTLPVSHILQRQIIGWLTNDEFGSKGA